MRIKSSFQCVLRINQGDLLFRFFGLDSLDDTIGEACAICAEAVSTWVDECARGDAYNHILETVYFTVIFVLRSIHELGDYAKTTANRHIYTVTHTLTTWIDAVVVRCLDASNDRRRYDMDKLKAKILFRSLVDMYVSVILSLLFQ